MKLFLTSIEFDQRLGGIVATLFYHRTKGGADLVDPRGPVRQLYAHTGSRASSLFLILQMLEV
ncbi:hypothetical protein N9406_08610 [Verrucomicrobiales bacterium]|nr:hypothetical protein [Verrucomicrobiales bacterium]MDB3941016.1 hypothetical protein [Verrucomicrobiales bacterium]